MVEDNEIERIALIQSAKSNLHHEKKAETDDDATFQRRRSEEENIAQVKAKTLRL